MEFKRIAEVLDAVSETSKRREKISLVSSLLKEVPKSEVEAAALLLGGRIFAETDEQTLNISWKGLLNALHNIIEFDDKDLSTLYEGDTGEAIAALVVSKKHTLQELLFREELTIAGVMSELTRLASVKGKGSIKEKQAGISRLMAEASPRELRYITALILNDMRTGLSGGLLAESIAEAFSIDGDTVRRAWSFSGDIGYVARVAAEGGRSGVEKITINLLTPIKPMLATSADMDYFENLASNTEFAFELKLDGARVQIHKDQEDIRIFSRQLSDVTESLPDIVDIVRENLRVNRCILDGEVIAIDDSGKPFPFQVVMTRFGRTREVKEAHQNTKLHLLLFDILLQEDQSLVDEPYSRRRNILEENIPSEFIVERLVSSDINEVTQFFAKSQELGHEGLVAKTLDSPYFPGVRGKYWLKLKHTLEAMDLVIVAAEWGHGRRSKWLSDYHLAVRDDDTGEFVTIGKTYKGLTDDEFEKMTQDLKNLEITSHRHVVQVRPEIVVEVLAAEIQKSPTYSSGYALRFARIINIREDKGPQDVMTLQELEILFDKQFRYKAR